jgi:hypothetical protein
MRDQLYMSGRGRRREHSTITSLQKKNSSRLYSNYGSKDGKAPVLSSFYFMLTQAMPNLSVGSYALVDMPHWTIL